MSTVQVAVHADTTSPSTTQRVLVYTLISVLGACGLCGLVWFFRAGDDRAGSRSRIVRRRQSRRDRGIQTGDFTSKTELMVLHCIAIILHTLSGVAGLLIAKTGDPKVTVTSPLFEFQSQSTTGAFFTPRPKNTFSVRILVPTIIVEFITAGFHCIYLAALMYPDIDLALREYVADTPSANPLRWVEYAITATTMSAFGAISIGITDFYYFLKMVFTGACLQALGYGIENLDLIQDTVVRDKFFFLLYYVLGQLTNLPSIAILLYQIFGSQTHGAFWLFLQNVFPFALWYNTFGIISQLSYKKWRQFRDPYFTERWYIILSLSTKIAVFWLGFGTFKKITEDNGFSTKVGVDWNAIRYSAMAIPAAWVLIYAIYDMSVWREVASKGSEYYLLFFTEA